jgi:tetratricopeptide (TPR) repeat protein
LSHEPFLIEGKAQEQSGRLDRAIALMEEARRRRPTYLPTRLHLAAYYAQTRRYPEFLAEVDYALTTNPRVRQALLPEMVKLLAEPQGRRALADMLASNPEWGEEFFSAANTRRPRPQDSAELAALLRARRAGPNLQRAIDLHVQALVEAGDYRGARALAMPAGGAEAGRAYVFDGGFTGERGRRPFSWTLADDESGRAAIVPQAGEPYLDIAHFGGSNARLAEQIIVLPPGRYQLRLLARSEEEIPAGRLRWAIGCLPADREIVSLPLQGLQPRFRPLTATFAIPAGCTGQALRLLATAGEIASPISAQVASLEVRGAN